MHGRDKIKQGKAALFKCGTWITVQETKKWLPETIKERVSVEMMLVDN